MSDSGLAARLARFKPFPTSKHKVDDEDTGDEIDSSTVAGGGHAARESDITRSQLRVSHALRSFLVHQGVLSEEDAGAHDPASTPGPLYDLIEKPHINVPPSVTDRSHALPEYFISSSHNTYLLAHQLYGQASATAYETALNAGARCVEIDAWDDEDHPEEPKVTHGYTLTSHIPFRSVCETMRDFVDREAAQAASNSEIRPAPIFLSLENHCNAQGQQRLVDIMTVVWGDRLLSKHVREKGHQEQQGTGEHVTLEELLAKIVVIVEYHYPDEPSDSDDDPSSSSEDEAEDERRAREIYNETKKSAPPTAIIPELAELGVYAQSVKPQNTSWFSEVGLKEPHHHLINVSETGLSAHMPAESDKIARHNAQHLMRVYPKGTRISSKNLNPVPFWALGAQICALNWQTFAAPLQLNEALFSGSDGYVLKPAALRSGGSGKLNTGKKKRLRLHVAGASDVPIPLGREATDIKPYLTCTLVHPDDVDNEPTKRKTAHYKQHKLGFFHSGENPPAKDPVWDETLEWQYEDNEMVFLRMLIKSDDSFARNPKLAVAAHRVRIDLVQKVRLGQTTSLNNVPSGMRAVILASQYMSLLSRTLITSTAAGARSRSSSFRFRASSLTFAVRMASTLPSTPIFEAIARHDPKSPAIVHSDSDRTFSYGSLLHDVAAAKDTLSALVKGKPLSGERIAFLAENGYDYVVTFLSILSHDAIALPLAPTHPNSELRYILENSEAALFLSTQKFQGKAQEVVKEGLNYTPQFEVLSKIETGAVSAENVRFNSSAPTNNGGFMLYTSGTTNRPKGVVLTIPTMTAQARSLIEAWKYTPSDLLLHVLPLHHIHGTINALFTPLMAGAAVEFAYPFNADTVWKRLALPFLPHSPPTKRPITFLTVVPTIYNRLLASHSTLSSEMQEATRTAITPQYMRLNISGSAALPTPTKQAWTELSSGNVLLERYGMTEVGMALSCGLAFEDRVDGSVGWPLPSVEVRLVDTETGEVVPPNEEVGKDGKLREGEIQLRGPTIFKEYFRNPKATAEEFVESDDNGGKWFKTGDVAVRQSVPGTGQSEQESAKGPMYFIRGRKSVDIIKTGGEKVSALEIERELLSLPEISEAAVVGLPSEQWGQKVAAVVVLAPAGLTGGRGGKQWGVMDMRRALKDKLANYKIPQELKVVESIPRNAMGKINKKTLIKDVFGQKPL